MRYGFWLPVFGGWLRNIDDEQMPATWEYTRSLVQQAEELGYDLTLIAELNLNDIKGPQADSMDAWTTAAALAAVTRKLELMVAVRPTFHNPALLAKQAANIDRISQVDGGGRLTLNVVSSWWADEAKKYGIPFDEHDDRYARTSEWLDVLDGCWSQQGTSFSGRFYDVQENILSPKPMPVRMYSRAPEGLTRPTLYAGGESETAKNLIAAKCDAYLMHGDDPRTIAAKVEDMRARRAKHPELPPLVFGVTGYCIVRDSQAEAEREVERITAAPDPSTSPAGFANFEQWTTGSKLEKKLSLRDYSVSNRGLHSGLIGTPEAVKQRLDDFEGAGCSLVLLQSSPQKEEMARFAKQVMAS
jgi:dimethylsulfone monooxygenase